jgi:hypothetical protein
LDKNGVAGRRIRYFTALGAPALNASLRRMATGVPLPSGSLGEP